MSLPVQVHGHRGCAGPFPANTAPAFLEATAAGCHWLEMDVVITGDNHVLVSHEPWMDQASCLGPDGQAISEAEGRALNIFRMPLAEVQRYAVIVAGAPQGHRAHKPALGEVVEAVRAFAQAEGIPVPGFNIEVKSDPAWAGRCQPPPEAFAQRVLDELAALGIAQHCLVQCFDPALLEAMHRRAPAIPLALLADNGLGLQANLRRLSFRPRYYSPAHRLADTAMAATLRGMGIGLLAWTVNEPADMRRMIALGVDGLITDHPREALALLAEVQ